MKTARPTPPAPSLLPFLAWLVPGVPLVWGVWQTMIKVTQLFQ